MSSDDIVERLRGICIDWDGSAMPDGATPRISYTCGMLRELADELTRLRAERDALAAELGATQTQGGPEVRLLQQHQEIARLRGALRRIETETLDVMIQTDAIGAAMTAQDIARTALGDDNG